VLIGLLGVQGGVIEHQRQLAGLGAHTRLVRRAADLDNLDGIVLPGGESTTMRRLMIAFGLWEPLRQRLSSGLPALGTCAGMILLSGGDGADPGLQAIDITVQRNAFGSQAHSFQGDIDFPALMGKPFPGVFIRAPRIVSSGAEVDVVAHTNGWPIAASSAGVLVTAFHPELTDDDRIHRMWLDHLG